MDELINERIEEEWMRSALTQVCKHIYARATIDLGSVDLQFSPGKFSRFVEGNRLCFLFSHLYSEDTSPKSLHASLQKWGNNRDAYVRTLKAALEALHEVSGGGGDWMLIKTISSYPHITSDIDVLVKDSAVASRLKLGLDRIKWNRDESGDLKVGLLPIEIDLQTRVSWTSSAELSQEFIWSNATTSDFDGVPFQEPNAVSDTLMRVGHIMLELAEIRLGELLHIYHQAEKLDWSILEREATLRGWTKTYQKICRMIEGMHENLYGGRLTNEIPTGREFDVPITFPFRISYWDLATAVYEKRAWKKVWGARYLLKDRLLGGR